MSFSRTAVMVAAWRARMAEHGFDLGEDPWAPALAGADGPELAARYERTNPHICLWVGLRTAFIDRQVRALGNDLSQVVLLGAGLDTRAARLAAPGVRFFEVDLPASAEEKQRRLAALDGYPVDAATYVPCDLAAEDFTEALAAHGFDAEQPAVFVWEGVTYYLSEDAVRTTLSRYAERTHPESVMMFDFVGRRAVDRPQGETLSALHELVNEVGEPLRFGTNDLVPLIAELGLRHLRTVSFDEICLSYTGTYDRGREFRFQSMAIVSRAREPAV